MIDIERTLRLLDVEAESNFVQAEAIDAINYLLRENARLREALKPFAKNYWSDDWHDGSDCEINVQLRDIRRAASLVDGYVWTPDE